MIKAHDLTLVQWAQQPLSTLSDKIEAACKRFKLESATAEEVRVAASVCAHCPPATARRPGVVQLILRMAHTLPSLPVSAMVTVVAALHRVLRDGRVSDATLLPKLLVVLDAATGAGVPVPCDLAQLAAQCIQQLMVHGCSAATWARVTKAFEFCALRFPGAAATHFRVCPTHHTPF
jgi:hypothetical protein